MSWNEQLVAVIAGAAALVVLVALAHTMPRVLYPLFMGLGFAYALIVFANALDLTTLETLPILCLTATFGSTVALVATLTPWLRPGTWYAVLIVTTIPFLIAVGVLFVEIRGWVALSTGVTFLLALALVITRRPGLTIFLRAAAAAILVPSLSVVILALSRRVLRRERLSDRAADHRRARRRRSADDRHHRGRTRQERPLREQRPRRPTLDRDLDSADGSDRGHPRVRPRGRRPRTPHSWCSSSWASAPRRRRSGRTAGTAGSSPPSPGPARSGPPSASSTCPSPSSSPTPCRRHSPPRRRRHPGRARQQGGHRALRERPRRRHRVVARRARRLRIRRGCGAPLARIRSAGRVAAASGDRHPDPRRRSRPSRTASCRCVVPTLVLAIAAAASGAIQGMRYGWGFDELPSRSTPTTSS